MSYEFSLQKLLDLKEKEKEQLQSALASSMKNLENEMEVNVALHQKRENIETEVLQSQAISTSIASLNELHAYQQRLLRSIKQSDQRVAKAEKEVDRKRQQVIEKTREEKTYQVLKSREWTRYQYEQNRLEQNMLDEISINLYLREEK